MCRISGIINPALPVSTSELMVKKMCSIMKHGGPDDEGIYSCEPHRLVLGHRRLSLIDLSPGGHQPMSYAGRYEISFNGEIYNYRELKEELKRVGFLFKTGSDTEVILAAFAAWGTASFDKLDGMFAFALWDSSEAKLYLVRDSAGIKPLYYAITNEGLAFASEIKGFAPIPYLQEENNHWPVYLMAYGHLPEPITTLKKVQPLTKGTFLCYDANNYTGKIESFRQYHFTEKLNNREQAISMIQDTLYESVKRHLIADAPLGVFLSGGLDSSIITVLANREKKSSLNTLSLYFEDHEFSEKKYQDILLEKMDCRRNQYLLKETDFHENLPHILQAMDQPSCDGINTWFISKYARENGLKAVLSGIGGDELYGGYPSFARINKVNLLESLPNNLLKAGKFTGLKKLRRLGYLSLGGAAGKYLFLRGRFIPYEIARHLNMSEEQVWEILKQQPQCENISDLSAHNQASWIETNLFMQNQLLRDVDVMSMSHGVEIRVPFLDKKFIELSYQVKSSIKYDGRPKQLLIDSFKAMLPEPIWNRPKMGFAFPFKNWLSHNEYIKNLAKPNSKAYNQFVSGKMHWSQFLSLILIKNRGDIEQGSIADTFENPANTQKFYKKEKSNQPESKPGKILFLTLRTFSITGGIEKVSKVAGKALYELCGENGNTLSVCSMYDEQRDVDEKYFPATIFTGFGIHKIKFIQQCVRKGINNDVVMLSHINLLLPGYLIKILSPKTKLILIAHGIEAWKKFYGIKKRMLLSCDKILTVSRYTADVLKQINKIPVDKLEILNNCLDPFLQPPVPGEKSKELLNKYGFLKHDTILMTLTRLAAREKYKGYDIVIESIRKLRNTHPFLKYLIVGKYDKEEKERLDGIIENLDLKDRVVFAGFIPDEELADHFNLADVYIMPSEKEGFGIVFIEAMYYNKPVIAGNKDGSVDALLDGKLGLLVNPTHLEEVACAIKRMVENKEQYYPNQELLMENFSYPVYKKKWEKVLEGLRITNKN